MVLATLALGLATYAQHQGDALMLEGDGIRLVFDQARGDLLSLAGPEGHILAGRHGLWTLSLAPGAGRDSLTPADAGSFRCAAHTDGSVELTWTDFGLQAAPELTVTARVELVAGTPEAQWRFALSGLGEARVRGASFPELPDITEQPDERLAVPLWLGLVTDTPREVLRGGTLRYDYPGLTAMQFIAWYREGGPGLMLACDDTRAFRKSFVLQGDAEGRVTLRVEHLPEQQDPPPDTHEPPYAVVVRLFEGGWFGAAEAYRASPPAVHFAAESRAAHGLTPDWVRETSLWVWNRGRSPEVLGPAVAMQERLGLPVSVLWHWWHGCSYDEGFPEYLPPREGEEAFAAAVERSHAAGIHSMVYMNQRLWGMTTDSWEQTGAERFAVKDANGRIAPEVYNTFTQAPCAAMCIFTEFWRDTYASLAERAIDGLGVDGIYMDQACSSLPCYDPAHGHPLGGGTYWMEGFRRLTEDIRERTHGRVALAGEGVGEAWLPHLDVMLSLEVSRERYAGPDPWRPIPLFQAVYHPVATQFGNYSSLVLPPYDEKWPQEFAPEEAGALLDTRFHRQFLLEQARAFVWGQQPGIANFTSDQWAERPEETAYVMRLARLRREAEGFLARGTMLLPPELTVDEETTAFSRISIYAGRDGMLTEFERRASLALAAAWRSPEGRLGIAIASIAEEGLDVELRLDPAAHDLPERAQVWRLDESGRRRIGDMTRHQPHVALRLAPRDACVLELTPE